MSSSNVLLGKGTEEETTDKIYLNNYKTKQVNVKK